MELNDLFDTDKFHTNTFDIHDIVETNEPIYEINYESCIKSRSELDCKSKPLKKYKCSKCNICDKKFKYKSSLNNHIDRHRNLIYKLVFSIHPKYIYSCIDKK